MERNTWRWVMPIYFAYLIAFPLGMAWVEMRPPSDTTICVFRLITHIDCPGCGLTRAFREMGRLDIPGAIRYNPLGPLVFLGAVGWWVYITAQFITRGQIKLPAWWQRRWPMVLWWFAIVFVIAGVMRMIYEIHYPPPPPVAPDIIRWLFR